MVKEENNQDKKQDSSDVDEGKPDFSFKEVSPDYADVSSEIDKALEKTKTRYDPSKEFKIEHVTDKIKFAKTIKEEPPEKGFMNVDFKDAEVTEIDENDHEETYKGVAVITEHGDDKDPTGKKIKKIAVYDGIFNIDLNVDAYWWFVRSCNIFPTILDQGIRTHLDIKRSHEPEKRKIEIPYFLIGAAVLGLILLLLVFNMMLK